MSQASSSATAAVQPHVGRPHVGLFVTCLADVYRPSVGFAALKLLQQAGCRVTVPDSQTCCGQPAWNSGDRPTTQTIAKATIAAFEGFDYVVLPSGSCGGMLKEYPAVLDGDPQWQARASALADKTWELTSFLTDVLQVSTLTARLDGIAAYHDSCTGLRRLKIKAQPRALLAQVKGLTVRDLANPEECCGFGGTFCVKYGDISNKMVSDKVEDIIATGADTLLAGDVGCLLNMAGKLKKIGSPIKVRHVAEVLADMADQPAIGEAEAPR